MATYYFDRNSTTAGFGTLTGAWDTTTASWTTSGAGTTTPVAYTFTSSDEAKFGNTGVAGTVGGIATIAAALTITLNKVTTQNIAALQTIAGTNATTSVLSFAGTTPTIDVQSAGHLTISSKISGSSGFTKSGSNILTLLSTNNDITGTITISAGTLILGATGQSGDTLPTVTDYNISATTATLRALSNTAYTFTEAITGSGSAIFQCSNASGITLEDGVLVGLTNSSATYGAGVFANAVSSRLNIKDFPSKLAFVLQGASPTGSIYYSKVAALTTSSTINLDTSLTTSGTITANLYNDDTSSSSNNLVISGAIGRTGTGTVVFGLRGGNTGNNELSGIISNSTGVINISKSDAGKWILSGNNTFTGTIAVSAGELRLSGSNLTSAATTLSGGTLTIANQNAIQNSTITHQTSGTTLSFDGALTAATFGGLAGTLTAGVTLTVPAGLTLSIGNNNTATSYANILAGSGNLTKIGTSTLTLTNTSNSLSGTATINAGTLILGGTAQSGLTLPSISSIVLGSTSANLSVLSNQAETFSETITGTGNAYFQCTNASGMTIDSAVWSGLTNSSATIGAGVAANGTVTSRINISNFPPKLAYYLDGASPTANIYYSNAAPATNINVINLDMSGAPTGTVTAGLYNINASTSDILVQSGNVSTTGAGTVTFSLRGSNAGNNEISGIISNPTGTVNINKNDAGKWILSGNNTFTGTITVSAGELKLSGSNSTSAATTLSGGTLTIANQNAIQNSTLTHQTAGTTLSFDPALTAVTFGGLSGTLVAGVTFDIPSGLNLSIGNNNAATTYANLITGSGTLTKVGSAQTTLTGSNTGFNGNLVSSGSSGTLLTGSFTAITDAIPAISSVTMNDGIVQTASTTSKTITYNITFNSPIPSNLSTGSSYFGSGGVSSGDTVLHTYTGTISGTGVFALWAPNASVAATRYVRTKTSSLPSTLGMVVNSWTQFRRATYEWGGGNYDVGTNVLLDALDSNIATSDDTRGIFSIVHRGTTDTEFVLNNINKTSGTAVTFGSYLRLGSASDVGDIKVKGVISQSVASLGIDKQGPRKLTLSGANTYTFNTLLSGGELVIANANALQNSTFTNQTAGTTLTFDPSLTAATFGGLSGTATVGVTLTIPSSLNLSVSNNGANTTYSNSLDGTGTLTKINSASTLILNGAASGFTGTLALTNGLLYPSNTSFGAMTINHATTGIRSSKNIFLTPTVTNGYSFPAGFNLTGLGSIHVASSNVTSLTTGFTFPAGATAGLTGTVAGTTGGGATSGLALVTACSAAALRTVTVNLNDLPGGSSSGVLTFEFNYDSTNTALTQNLYYIASGSTHNYGTRFDILSWNSSVAIGTGSKTVNFYANQASGALVLNGGMNRTSIAAYTVTLNLRGTSSEYNEISGNITQSSGTLAINKTDSGTWVLSGTNTYTGASTLTSGILNVRNNNAFGSSTSGSVTLTSGTLEIQGDISLNKSTPSAAFNGSIIKNVSGSNSFITGTSALGAATTFEVNAGSSLTFPGVITGSNIAYSVNKTGGGIMRLSSVSNSYIGPTIVSGGTLEFVSVNDAGSASNSSLGKPAIAQSDITLGPTSGYARLSHVGSTAVSTNRNLIFSGFNGTLIIDSSGAGSGAITYSSGGSLSFTDAGIHTINFDGTNTNTNTFARTIADGPSGSTYIQKFGTNTWVLSTITATGYIDCYEGTLNLSSSNVTTISALYTNGGTIAITNGYTISANTEMGGGTITAVLTGNKTLVVNSNSTEVFISTLQPDDTNGNNSITGAVTISGCVDLVTPNALTPSTSGTARVLGTSNTVTIASGGIVRTKYSPSSSQNGSARYYNLVLQNNSTMKIGLAA